MGPQQASPWLMEAPAGARKDSDMDVEGACSRNGGRCRGVHWGDAKMGNVGRTWKMSRSPLPKIESKTDPLPKKELLELLPPGRSTAVVRQMPI